MSAGRKGFKVGLRGQAASLKLLMHLQRIPGAFDSALRQQTGKRAEWARFSPRRLNSLPIRWSALVPGKFTAEAKSFHERRSKQRGQIRGGIQGQPKSVGGGYLASEADLACNLLTSDKSLRKASQIAGRRLGTSHQNAVSLLAMDTCLGSCVKCLKLRAHYA